MTVNFVTLQQSTAINDNINTTFGVLYEIRDLSTGDLVTTSGELNTSTLNATILSVIQSFQNRKADYTFTLNNVIVAILHQNDTYELEP